MDPRPDPMVQLLLTIASIALIAMMLVVVGDVAMRFIFNLPVRGAYDLVSAFLLVMVFFGIGPVIATGREILIDLLDGVIPNAWLRILRLVAGFGTLAAMLFIGWAMISPARDAYRYGGTSLELGWPVWILWVAAFVGFFGILWCAAWALVRIWREGGGR